MGLVSPLQPRMHRCCIVLFIVLRKELCTSLAKEYKSFVFSFTTDCNKKEKYSLVTNACGARSVGCLQWTILPAKSLLLSWLPVAINAFKTDFFLRAQCGRFTRSLPAKYPVTVAVCTASFSWGGVWKQEPGELLVLLPHSSLLGHRLRESCPGGCPLVLSK